MDQLNVQNLRKKFERERTANFCFCSSHVSHNLGRKNQMEREISSHCDNTLNVCLGRIVNSGAHQNKSND